MSFPSTRIVQPLKGIDVPGLTTRDLTFESFRNEINPFLVVSLFDMTGPVFPPHPHGGFSVATYIFPESEIGFWNQDTIGNSNATAPGSIHWTVAGNGLMHEETVQRSGKHARGFQIWIDHAAAKRHIEPAGLHLKTDDVPVLGEAGVTKRILVGASGDVVSPLAAPTPVRILDVEMEAGTTLSEALLPGENVFAWVREGEVIIGQKPVKAGEAVLVKGDAMMTKALGHTRFMVFAAVPFVQSLQPGGPFVGSDADEIRAFHRRFRTGDMGKLTPFNQNKIDRDFDAARV
jgi:redox-sensitive bicupin YhaK (pirin superfamily)